MSYKDDVRRHQRGGRFVPVCGRVARRGDCRWCYDHYQNLAARRGRQLGYLGLFLLVVALVLVLL